MSLAAAANGAATPASNQSCEALQPPAESPSPSATPTATSPSATPTTSTPANSTTANDTGGGTSASPTHPAATAASGSVTARPAGSTSTDPPTTPTAPASTTPAAGQVSLCVAVTAAQASSERGQQARWTVSAWTTGGAVPAATIKLQVSPASGGAPKFSFGCGKSDGTSSCDLGAVDVQSAHRQLQAQLTVPVTASAVKSVSLTVIGTAAKLPKAARASAAVAITAPRTQAVTQPAPITAPVAPLPTMTVTSPLPVGSLPGIPPAGPVPTQSEAGNAAGLFPKLNPTPAPGATRPGAVNRVADTSALPEGASVVNAQLAGLAALALAFVLAVTRLSIRRPPRQPAGQSGPKSRPGTSADNKPGAGDKPDAPSA